MWENYRKLSDEELIEKYRGGDPQVADFLMNKYKNMVRSQAEDLYMPGADTEDLLQEGMIGLFKAVRDYRPGQGAAFFTFAYLCVSRQMLAAVKASGRQKHAPLNNYVSLTSSEETTASGEGTERILAGEAKENPEQLLLERENQEQLEAELKQKLSVMEKQVLDLFMAGMSQKEIAQKLGLKEKSVDNALRRVRTKLRGSLLHLTKRG
ncbi:MAG: sigma-70 family RNA polymerase sigma factor [Lachnospiraceae bacterium]|nr:sigma-70 family RNA polymerase sigma factor [Lachnospiraceae bacterium]